MLETDRQTDRQTDRHADRQTGRQAVLLTSTAESLKYSYTCVSNVTDTVRSGDSLLCCHVEALHHLTLLVTVQ